MRSTETSLYGWTYSAICSTEYSATFSATHVERSINSTPIVYTRFSSLFMLHPLYKCAMSMECSDDADPASRDWPITDAPAPESQSSASPEASGCPLP